MNESKDIIKPPNFSTVRFNPNRISVDEAIVSLRKFIEVGLLNENIFAQKLHVTDAKNPVRVEQHPVLKDCLVVDHNSIGKFLKNISPSDAKLTTDKEVIVDKRCGLSVMRGSHIYLPGIVSATPGIYKNCIVNVFIDIDKKCLKGSKFFNGRKLFIGNGLSLYNRKDMFCNNEINKGIGVRMILPIFPAPSLSNSTLPAHCFAQNLPSIVVTHVLAPLPGSVVLDMCAAPGGKTTHLCSIMNGIGHVVSLDKSKKRLEKIKENVKLLDFEHMVHHHVADSNQIINENSERIMDEFTPPFNRNSFKYILLDAPCSGLGQRPCFTNDTRSEKELKSYPILQRQLFKTAYELLTTGGSLVYCTCTTSVDENECIVEWALNEFPSLELCIQTPRIGSTGRKGCTNLSDNLLNRLQYFPMPNEQPNTLKNKEHYHPANSDTIGFFISKFHKKL